MTRSSRHCPQISRYGKKTSILSLYHPPALGAADGDQDIDAERKECQYQQQTLVDLGPHSEWGDVINVVSDHTTRLLFPIFCFTSYTASPRSYELTRRMSVRYIGQKLAQQVRPSVQEQC